MKPTLGCVLLVVGCAATSETVAPRPDASAHQRLQQQRTRHTELLKYLADAPAAHVDSCRATAGDCLFQVGESRSRLTSRLRLSGCESDEDFRDKSRCVVTQLESGGRAKELSDYLSLESWCFEQLHVCTASLAEEERLANVEAVATARQHELESSPAAQAARGAALAARARIEYLRTTLPPDVAACKPEAEQEACVARAESARQALDESLRRDDYALGSATSSYVALQDLEESCVRPELECLSSIVRSYGVFPESRKWVDRNLELLGKRQTLVARLAPDGSSSCVSGLQQQHQAGIVSAYVAYVREPVLYFRTQLDKAFLALHQAQVSCLSGRSPSSAPKPAVAAQR